MVDIYPVVQSPPPVVSTITTSVTVNANSTYYATIQEQAPYLTKILFFQMVKTMIQHHKQLLLLI